MIRKRLWLATALAVPVLGALALAVASKSGGHAIAATTAPAASEAPTAPGATYVSRKAPDTRRAFFGDLHLHTAMSFDAWSFGTKATPDQAYKFARGETVMIPASQVAREEGFTPTGMVPARRRWPLDFMAVTDHSEFMGVMNQLDDPSSPVARTPIGQKILADPHQAFLVVAPAKGNIGSNPEAEQFHPQQAMLSTWNLQMKAANDNYQPGKFTTFIAYEWTSAPDGKNLHRNVFFNADHAPPPFTSAQSNRPEDLWSFLEKVRASGIDVIAIPHNANASDGLMYDWNDSDGRPISEAYAQRRLKNEPLTEIAQNKGVSDTTPTLSPNDEFANYELYDHLISRPTVKSREDGSYVRQALGRGLALLGRVGANPYKYGLVGATDIHNGLSFTDPDGVGGSFGAPAAMLPMGDAAKRALQIIRIPARLDSDADAKGAAHSFQKTLEVGTGGVTGVWAEENTRNSIYAALKRKETFATSGTRIRVRMFASWAYPAKLQARPDWVKVAYATGVPMGSDLPATARPTAPTLVLQAMKDPDGANLDRIQVIKMWRDGDGYKERIFNVALSGGRHEDAKGKAPAVGDTVDLKTGKYANTIGAPVLTAQWTDPTFDASKPAVYYARVLEIPTPRWSTLLAIKNQLPIPTEVPATIQERAWSSPVWFTPPKTTKVASR
ncbi:DUF3604 domain-containing protein [Phenylobacterium sp.]|jgi:hypothetical protein|uniref:DUF3604 domain-containing protein n=1 Tax=Phenylobacterium sp. TaxID=1871053 RepID=UPI002E3248CF|nr:DUF3604 domain-containing protein [Phenylobacterium sp.]HEX3367548.1 DUF3604 domain-containing protein [Phenylobacterium sp.]